MQPTDATPTTQNSWIVGVATQLAIGGLLIFAQTSGWTTNDLYPLFGCVFLGIGVGMLLARTSGKEAWVAACTGLGFAGGAFFLDNRTAQIVLWVLAAGSVLEGLKRLRTSN